MAEAVTEERYRRLVELTVQFLTDAERCAEIECFYPACVMAGAATEAALLAYICVCEPEVRTAGEWQERKPKGKEPQQAPFDWPFERLIQIAMKMQWLPVTKDLASAAPVEKLVGEVGDAVRFVQQVRNLAAHPGKHAYETAWLTIGRTEYDIVHGVAQTVFDRLYELLGELEPGQAP